MQRWYVSDPRFSGHFLAHHGIKEQQWGVRRGPPYPLSRTSDGRINVSKQENRKDRSGQNYGSLRFKSSSLYDDNGLKLKRKSVFQDTIARDMKAVNPTKYGDKFRNRNCPYCSLAYDLRRRGYDVCAPDKPEVREKDLVKFYEGFDHKWFLSDEEASKPQFPSAQRAKDITKWATSELKAQGIGARGFFDVTFGDSIGHSMAYEVTDRGVMILDTQNNKSYSISQVASVITDVGYCRVDDKVPNFAYLKKKGAYVNC